MKNLFPTTRWSLLDVAGGISGQDAVAELIRIYMPALRSWLLRAKRVEPELAEDVLQGFLLDKMVRGYLFRMADRERGRFRNLLLKALGNYLATFMSRRARDNANVVVVENEEVLGVGSMPEQDDVFDFAWAQTLIRTAIDSMKDECGKKQRADLWEIFEGKIVAPIFEDKPPVSYEELVLRFGFKSPREAVNLFVTARRMFLRCLEVEAARYMADDSDIQGEIRYLLEILPRMNNL
jgi:DNA-directed RNA polymerase specialized sigma24 family protein